MARRQVVEVQLIDDLDGKPAETTVTFGLNGHLYEIELSRKNARELDKAIQPYVRAGRRVVRPRKRRV